MDSKIDFPLEPKPIHETKGDDGSDNFTINVHCVSTENEKAGFSAGNFRSKSEHVVNRTAEGKLCSAAVSTVEQIDSEESEKQNKRNVTEKYQNNNKCDGLQLCVKENEEKEVLDVENNFMQQIHSKEDILKDGFYASSIETNSSGITKSFEAHEDFTVENKCMINHVMFEDSSAKEFPDIESFNFTKGISTKQETGDKNDCLQLCLNENEEKEVLEVENDFMQQIDPREDVSRDGSYASSFETNSSGIENDFEDCLTENEDEMNGIIFEEASRKKENEASENLGLEKNEENIILMNNEEFLKEDKDVVPSHDSVSLFNSITFPYKNPANCFDVVVPLIGKNVMPVGDIQPFNHRYDLARERNRLKGLQEDPYLPKISYHEWRKQRDARPQEEKDREERHEKLMAIKTAAYIVQVATFILQEMQKDDPDEGIIKRCFLRFLRAPVSPMSLLLSSHFVHVTMYIRGSPDFSHRLRSVADRCYMRCHAMFPILEGYNFETIYTSEVIKNIPEQLDGMRNFILDYEDFEYPASESDDSAFSDDD